ncbi:MAG: hypothetical protein HQ464_14400 [Planctomycetes bacterium]|nr:hypothetical protein [Planctomycetota bacterium]
MRITHNCPACHATVTIDRVESLTAIECPACRATLPIPPEALTGDPQQPRLLRCLICPSTELFVRKDFPQRIGVAIVVAGLAASCVAWANRELFATFGILFGTALLDVVLFFIMPDCLSCYRCNARYRGDGLTSSPATSQFGGFDLETHEKHRQLAARTSQLASDRNSNAAGSHATSNGRPSS